MFERGFERGREGRERGEGDGREEKGERRGVRLRQLTLDIYQLKLFTELLNLKDRE